MEKKLRADWTRRSMKALTLHRETLRLLEETEMPHVAGGQSQPSLCAMTTIQCCLTL
ncbi:MAG TPA: hypothetical protein VGS22_15275 [Thermoanaerobaculia bacterium]|jgi:hypothetical protein|nr:hypothetical protein [Thermoanaerobaculia bacterium]